jgi:predicted metalloprotease
VRWWERGPSEKVEDQQRFRFRARWVALGGVLVVTLLALFFRVNPVSLFHATAPEPTQSEGTPRAIEGTEGGATAEEFVSAILGETADVWRDVLGQGGKAYREPKVTLYAGKIDSVCGRTGSAVGPFYCPGDERIYFDMSFFQDLTNQLGPQGDFARAYVIAHEVGHHVQNLLGLSSRVEAMRGRLSETEFNNLMVRLELQADFLAGVWARYAQERMALLEPGDLEEALMTAGSVGDDRLQKRSRGTVVPDPFTHGTSEQRIRWFRLGLETGDVEQGDTFSAERL